MGVGRAAVTLLGDLAPIGVTCSKGARGRCSGTVTVQGQARALASVAAKTVVLGREQYSIGRGRTEPVLVSLNKRAIKAVKRTGRLRVTVVLTARDSDGKRAKPLTRAIVLRATKTKPKRTTPG
jgi:hypothetical protein